MAKRDSVSGLGVLLKSARERAGLAQGAAAAAAGVPQSNLSQFETDAKTPTLATLIKLAEAYGIDACDLIPKTSSPPSADEPAKPVTKGDPPKTPAKKPTKKK